MPRMRSYQLRPTKLTNQRSHEYARVCSGAREQGFPWKQNFRGNGTFVDLKRVWKIPPWCSKYVEWSKGPPSVPYLRNLKKKDFKRKNVKFKKKRPRKKSKRPWSRPCYRPRKKTSFKVLPYFFYKFPPLFNLGKNVFSPAAWFRSEGLFSVLFSEQKWRRRSCLCCTWLISSYTGCPVNRRVDSGATFYKENQRTSRCAKFFLPNDVLQGKSVCQRTCW